jgi:hypothetical protein
MHAPDAPHDHKVSKLLDGTPETRYPSDFIMLVIANFSDEELPVPKGTVLGVAQEISENLAVSLIDEEVADRSTEQTFSGSNKEVPKGFRKYVNEKLAHLYRAERKIIEPVLIKYAGIFHDYEDNDFRSNNVVVDKIETGDATPIKKAPYKTSFALRQNMNRQVQKMLHKGVISPSHSPWASPIVLVPKKSENGVPKYRFCFDFRALNAVTKYDSYPLHRFDDTTLTLSGSKYFSVLDCYSGFWKINIHEPHRENTTFSVPSFGPYQFNRLQDGLSNSPASFQRLMGLVSKNLSGTGCWTFLDDVIVYSDTAEEHAKRLANVFERFRRANLQLQPEKCVFAKDKFT